MYHAYRSQTGGSTLHTKHETEEDAKRSLERPSGSSDIVGLGYVNDRDNTITPTEEYKSINNELSEEENRDAFIERIRYNHSISSSLSSIIPDH